MSKETQKISFCFLEGEPAFFIKNIKDYHIIKCDYTQILNNVENEILARNFSKRPSFRKIWVIVSEQFPCCDGYNSSYTRRTHCRENSFESRISRDITAFLDTLYKRGLSPEEQLAKEKMKKENKDLGFSESARKFFIKKQKLILRGKRIY